ncbi:hypothetical protein Tsubulata_049148 [Turnera subulata]|uniref:F-box domain-containing protein n=1 Tax=Turnera subulata TaxID=218843 RepID=A0A9Q0G977_9ROSI|nr:hypothetical protein Tsubulata_049148 [Turnera subulata]
MKTRKKPSSRMAADKNKILRKIQPTHHLKNPKAEALIIKQPASLPYDTILELLSLLPSKSLLRFKYVSKELASIICDPSFVKNYNMYKEPGRFQYHPDNNPEEKILFFLR